jgi:hypothetical protein
MLNGVSLNLVDPIFPAAYGSVTNPSSAKESFDSCLGHPTPDGIYHYHALPPCFVDSSFGSTPKSCNSISTCSSNAVTYAQGAYSQLKSLTPIGLAKDGHIIWGPYN